MNLPRVLFCFCHSGREPVPPFIMAISTQRVYLLYSYLLLYFLLVPVHISYIRTFPEQKNPSQAGTRFILLYVVYSTVLYTVHAGIMSTKNKQIGCKGFRCLSSRAPLDEYNRALANWSRKPRGDLGFMIQYTYFYNQARRPRFEKLSRL